MYCAIKPCHLNDNNHPPTNCYAGVGLDYNGKTAVSRSGRKCWKWSSVTPRYANIHHSYCRNFIGDMTGPWCYVDHFVRELCDVPHCNGFHPDGGATIRNGSNGGDDDSSSKLVTYVVPFIVGMTVLLFSFFLFAFYWKNKKLMRQKNAGDTLVLDDHHPRLATPVTTAHPEETMNNKMNTLSTNASSARSLIDFSRRDSAKEFASLSSSCNSSTPPLEIRHQQTRFKKVKFDEKCIF